MQLRRHSLLEACINTSSGFVVSLAAGYLIYPLVGIPISHSQNLILVIFFTFISIARSYLWRRLFNKLTERTSA